MRFDNKRFANFLKLRKLSTAAFAQRMQPHAPGTTKASVWQWTRTTAPSARNLSAIARTLGVSIEQLIRA